MLKYLVILIAYLPLCAFATPLRFAVTDIAGLEELQREFKAFEEKLESLGGFDVSLYPVASRTAVVEALKFKKVDFVLTGPAEYVVIHERAKAVPVVGFSRPNYYSVVVTLAENAPKSLEALKGKKVGLGDVGSTSYYLAPLQIFEDAGMNAKEDLNIRHMSKQIGWAALKRGNIDALGFSHERFQQFAREDKDLTVDEFHILARGPELPNDVIVAGSHVPKEIAEKFRGVFVNHSEELVTAVLQGKRNDKYTEMHFIPEVKDEDYNYVRRMYQTAGFPEYAGKLSGAQG